MSLGDCVGCVCVRLVRGVFAHDPAGRAEVGGRRQWCRRALCVERLSACRRTKLRLPKDGAVAGATRKRACRKIGCLQARACKFRVWSLNRQRTRCLVGSAFGLGAGDQVAGLFLSFHGELVFFWRASFVFLSLLFWFELFSVGGVEPRCLLPLSFLVVTFLSCSRMLVLYDNFILFFSLVQL